MTRRAPPPLALLLLFLRLLVFLFLGVGGVPGRRLLLRRPPHRAPSPPNSKPRAPSAYAPRPRATTRRVSRTEGPTGTTATPRSKKGCLAMATSTFFLNRRPSFSFAFAAPRRGEARGPRAGRPRDHDGDDMMGAAEMPYACSPAAAARSRRPWAPPRAHGRGRGGLKESRHARVRAPPLEAEEEVLRATTVGLFFAFFLFSRTRIDTVSPAAKAPTGKLSAPRPAPKTKDAQI